jgi:hypothetical protein
MRVEDLERELRVERPDVDPEFARELDEWAAAGFPRDRGLGPRAVGDRRDPLEPARRAWERVRSVPPRRILLPAGALATVAVIGAVAVSGLRDESTAPSETRLQVDGEPTQIEPSTGGDADTAAEPAAPALEDAARQAEEGGAVAMESAVTPVPEPGGGAGAGIARGTDDRLVDATARITLGAEADDVQDVANQVVEVTDRRDGVVLDSQVTTDQGGARAAFTIEVPFDQLDAAIEDFSGLADVISRTEAGEDITQRAVRARKDLAETLDDLRQARIELIRADTRKERLIARSRIDALKAQADAFDQQLNGVKREARFATVNVDITSTQSDTDDGWSLDEAVDDSVDVLETIAGTGLVALAVLLPIGLVAALVWFLASRAQRARRERALDE